MTKIMKAVALRDLDLDTFDGDIDDIIERLKQFKTGYPDHTDFCISACLVWDSVEISLVGSRLETDAEYSQRLERERKQKERSQKAKDAAKRSKLEKQRQLEEQERAEYKRLKAKFGEADGMF